MKLHWSIVPCEWDSDFQVGDTMDLSFQVAIIIIIANVIIIITMAFVIVIIVIILISANVPNWGKPRPRLC